MEHDPITRNGCYKSSTNALQAPASKGSSLMQPLLPSDKPSTLAEIGSGAFAALAEADVAPDAAFFHRYYRHAPSWHGNTTITNKTLLP